MLSMTTFWTSIALLTVVVSSHAAFTVLPDTNPSFSETSRILLPKIKPTISSHSNRRPITTRILANKDDNDYDIFPEDDDYDDEYYESPRPRRRRRRGVRPPPIDNLSPRSPQQNDDNSLDLPSPFGSTTGLRLPSSVSKALLAGVFFLGIGTGVTVDSAINTNPKDLASRDAVDKNAPNPTICTTYGASAMAFDQRVFVSFNPFNVYVAQADVKPACVLRPANVVSVLRDPGLINDKEVKSCKANMNTWAFVGDLGDMPQLSCVYQSEDAQNEFLSNPKLGIGEDVWDDDREAMMMQKRSTGKVVKGGMTDGQVQKAVESAGEMRRDGTNLLNKVSL